MKKIISVFVIFCWLAPAVRAQNGGPQGGYGPGMQQQGGGGRQRPRAGELELMKIGFVTKRLNLTNEEAEKFWPIYYRYAAEIRQAHLAYQEHHDEIHLEESLVNIKKKYSVEFGKALPPDRVNEFFRAEKDFGAYVQKEAQRRQMQGLYRKTPAGE